MVGTRGLAAALADFRVFLVPPAVLNGRVRFRDWREEKLQEEQQPEAKRRLLSTAFKTRLCWFFSHHPDGCVLPADRCPFAHGPGELRSPPASGRKKRLP